MAAAAKKEQKVFKSLAEPLIDGLIDIAPSWPTTNDILSLVAVCVGALAIVSCIFMFCKLWQNVSCFTCASTSSKC